MLLDGAEISGRLFGCVTATEVQSKKSIIHWTGIIVLCFGALICMKKRRFTEFAMLASPYRHSLKIFPSQGLILLLPLKSSPFFLNPRTFASNSVQVLKSSRSRSFYSHRFVDFDIKKLQSQPKRTWSCSTGCSLLSPGQCHLPGWGLHPLLCVWLCHCFIAQQFSSVWDSELEAVVGLRIWNENDIQRGQEAGCNVNVILILLLPHSFRCGWPSLRACRWKDGLPKSSHPVLFFCYSLNTSRTEFFMLVAFAYWGLISICMYLIHRLTSIPPDSQGSCLVLLGVSMYSKPGWQNLSLFFFFPSKCWIKDYIWLDHDTFRTAFPLTPFVPSDDFTLICIANEKVINPSCR